MRSLEKSIGLILNGRMTWGNCLESIFGGLFPKDFDVVGLG